MIEMTDWMERQLHGKEALVQRVRTRLRHTTNDIPYYSRGVNLYEFTYGSKENAIRMGLRDMGISVSYDEEPSRVQVYEMSVDVSDII